MKPVQEHKDKSYQLHSAHFKEHAAGGTKEQHARTWLDRNTVDAWRHERMYKALDPILQTDQGASWLTVGDGRFGNDARYIHEHGSSALASDISDTLLSEAKSKGYITDYRRENAEALTFDDGEFDYAFCKESYHHFPRPMIALYEMLRVVRKGVVLIEPNDPYISSNISSGLSRRLKQTAKRLLRGTRDSKHVFEDSGNYLFSISRREMEKVALGLNLGTVAFRGLNDAFLEGVNYEKLSDNGPLQRRVRALITVANSLCRLGIMDYGLLVTIIFKQEPSTLLIESLQNSRYEVTRLPPNPHLEE